MCNKKLVVIILAFVLASNRGGAGERAGDADMVVDYRYSLPWWQCAINMIDNPDKILVGKEGQVLLDYDHNRSYRKNRGFMKWVEPGVEGERQWVKQELVSAKSPVVKTYWKHRDIAFVEETFVVTPESEPYTANKMLQRGAVIVVNVKNTGASGESVAGKFTLRGRGKVNYDKANGQVLWDETVVTASVPLAKIVDTSKSDEELWYEITLGGIEVAAGAEHVYVICISRDGKPLFEKDMISKALSSRERTVKYWENLGLPYDVIEIPDDGIANMLISSIRNIHQARDIHKGLPAYVVGPTEYRKLFIVDGAFLLEAATMLGMADDARNGIEYMWTYQRDDGGFTILPKYWKESGIVL